VKVIIDNMKKNSDSIREVFAKNLKNYREILKYSQEKLAEKAGLSVQSIKDIETCRRWVSDSTLTNLSKALNVSEFQLFLPEKFDNKYSKFTLKTIMVLKEKLKTSMDDQFENIIRTGDLL